MDAGQLWAGGAATAVVAGLIALVGVLVCRWLFNIPILAPKHYGAYGERAHHDADADRRVAALVATLLAHLLLLSTPRPMVFFGWIVGLVTCGRGDLPVQYRRGTLADKIATAAVYLVIGIAIGTLISGVGERAMRRRSRWPAHRRAELPGLRRYPGPGLPRPRLLRPRA